MSTQYPDFPDYLRNVCLQLVLFDLDLLLFRSGHLDQIDVFALDYFQAILVLEVPFPPKNHSITFQKQ